MIHPTRYIGLILLLASMLIGCETKHTPPAPATIPTTPVTSQDLDVLISSRGSATFRGRNRRVTDSDVDLIFLPQGKLFVSTFGLGVNDSMGSYDITSDGMITIHMANNLMERLGPLSLRKSDYAYLIFSRGGEKEYGKTTVGLDTWPLRLISPEDEKDAHARLDRILDREKQSTRDDVQNP